MRKLNLYFAVFIISIFVACSSYEDAQRLKEIEILSENYPDSAFVLLETEFVPLQMNDAELTEWCALYGKINDKLEKELDIDTLLLSRTISYCQRKGLNDLYARMSLYYGRVCVLFRNFNQAVPYYLLALEKAKEGTDDNLIAYICSYLADVYYEKYYFEEARELFEEAAKYFLKSDNIRSHGLAYRDIGATYYLQYEFYKALEYYYKTDSVMTLLNDSFMMGNARHSIANVYLELEEYEKARNLYLEALPLVNYQNRFYYALSRLHEKLEQYELAFCYLEKTFQDESGQDINLFTSKTNYWRRKSGLYKLTGDYEKALECFEKSALYRDSVWSEKNDIRVAEIARKYNYVKIAEHNTRLKNEANQLVIAILGVILICLVFYIVNFRLMLKKNRRLELAKKDIEAQLQLREANEIKLKKAELEMNEKHQDELELLKNKESVAKQSLLRRSLTFKKLTMLSELPTKNINAFKSEIEKILGTATLSEKDWEEIKNEINYVYPNFTERISREIPRLTEEEIRFCCLLKVGLDTSELSILLQINPESVNRRRTRINKKIREIYPESSWYEFIRIM